MSYDKEFFDKYIKYRQEPTVRAAHDYIFDLFKKIVQSRGYEEMNVVDLGCGTCEYFDHNNIDRYVGMDIEPQTWDDCDTFAGDFKTMHGGPLSDLIRKKYKFDPNIFVSLFATEVCLSADDKYKLYDKMFGGLSNPMAYGLVSGFYYKGKENQETVTETGGIVSYQTIEDQKKYWSSLYVELRTCIEVPSKMFGEDVIEVWKILIRHCYGH
jgi:hypothetical protein